MHFQEYIVRQKTKPKVQGVVFRGIESARPGKHVAESIAKARGIIVCPSNPVVSVGAILAVRGIKSALRKTAGKVVGISPIIGGKTVKGPADKLMKAVGIEASALGVAECYSGFLDTLIIDRLDRELALDIKATGIRPVVTNTLMKTMADKVRLAKIAIGEIRR